MIQWMINSNMPQFFTDLAGSYFLNIPADLSQQEISSFLNSSKPFFGSSVKVVFDNYETQLISQAFYDLADNSGLKISVEPYNSNFFVFDRFECDSFLRGVSMDNFETTEVNFEDKISLEIIKNLLVSSFAIKVNKDDAGKSVFEDRPLRAKEILDNFDSTFLQTGLRTYLVKSNKDEIVGCYSLIQVGHEVQLSGVAGRTTLLNGFQGKKLLILCQAMVSSFLNQKNFESAHFLTLSNSKIPVAQMYSELGIAKNITRKGLLVQIGSGI
jgi:hypothetical protein